MRVKRQDACNFIEQFRKSVYVCIRIQDYVAKSINGDVRIHKNSFNYIFRVRVTLSIMSQFKNCLHWKGHPHFKYSSGGFQCFKSFKRTSMTKSSMAWPLVSPSILSTPCICLRLSYFRTFHSLFPPVPSPALCSKDPSFTTETPTHS